MKYNWGDRQERADLLVKLLNKTPDKTFNHPAHPEYTYKDIADHINDGTAIGHEILSIAGIILFALYNDPQLREKLHKG